VQNRTEAPLEVALQGQVLGVVSARSRGRFRWLSAGEQALSARPSDETRRAGPSFEARLALTPGEVTSWNLALAPGDPEPPPLGALEVVNPSAHDLIIRAGGTLLGTVLAGDSRWFRDLPAALHGLEAADPARQIVVTATVAVPAEGAARFVVMVAYGRLTVTNDTPEDVQLSMGEAPMGGVEAGAERTFEELPPGRHDLVAWTANGHRVSRTVDLDPEFPVTWRLASSGAALEVTNRTREPIRITAPKAVERTLPPEGGWRLRDLPPGEVLVEGRGELDGGPHAIRASLESSQEGWSELRGLTPSIQVFNQSEKELQVYVDGVLQDRLPPGERLCAPVAQATVRVDAVDRLAEHHYHAVLEVGPSGMASWKITAPRGELRVENQRHEAVTVFMDARRLGRVEPGRGLTFTGIERGARLVEALGEETGEIAGTTLTISSGASAAWLLEDERAMLRVDNGTGETLEPLGPLAAMGDPVPPGGVGRFPVPAGARAFRLRGRATDLLYGREIRIRTGEEATWRLDPPVARLSVENQLPEAVAIQVEGHELGRVLPGETQGFGPLAAGLHRLRARGIASGEVSTALRRLDPASSATWILAAEPPRLLVHNPTEEVQRLLLERGGVELGSVAAGASKIFAAVGPGPAEIRAVGERSGRRQGFRVELAPGETERVTLDGGHGRLAVINGTGAVVRVQVDTLDPFEVAPGPEPVLTPVPAGRHWIAVDDLAGRRLTLRLVSVLADRGLELAIQPPHARLAIKNHAPSTRRVWLGDRLLGELGPGESLVVSDLAPGEIGLLGTDSDGVPSHAERRELAAGETATWELR
jgi:hypothetical protein